MPPYLHSAGAALPGTRYRNDNELMITRVLLASTRRRSYDPTVTAFLPDTFRYVSRANLPVVRRNSDRPARLSSVVRPADGAENKRVRRGADQRKYLSTDAAKSADARRTNQRSDENVVM